jgi:hypothetical protein
MKILAGMQPYFFPYLGYFDLIYNVDTWIVFDTPQYIKEGWVHRNRILHPKEGWRYIIVPIQKHAMDTPINKIAICSDQPWKEKVMRQLSEYKKKAPFYKPTVSLVEDCLAIEEPLLSRLNIFILEKVCDFLDIPFRGSVFSEMNLELGAVTKSGDWALRICQAMGADVLVNPPGGRHLYDAAEFQRNGVRLIIREFENMVYSCEPLKFEPALSIIDVLMWNSPKTIRDYLESKRIRLE